jgi:adenylate cyclase
MERKLAAILAVDVVGYSRLMEADEAATFERLRAHRKELFEPGIEKHHGRIFKQMGDGLLAEFGSVVDAVECAVTLQRGMAERNGAVADGERIDVRMGVHVGDVIVEGDDRHGDAVNIAARLQQLAEAGGICVSDTIVNHIRHKVALRFEPRGEERLKNIAEPVMVYRVLMGASPIRKTAGPSKTPARSRRSGGAVVAAALALAIIGGAVAWWRPWEPRYEPALSAKMALPLPDRPSIAVLPFTNMSDDPKQEYFADGITDDLITDLSQVSGLFVISRNSTFAYKGKVVPPKLVSEELGVRYVLEGSIQRADQQVRINAQLIDTTTGGHVWADRYEGSLVDIFGLQDKVTSSVADALALRLSAPVQQAGDQQETTVPAAYEALLRGWAHYRRTTPEDYAKAIPYLEEAIKRDPSYARAYAALAMVYFSAYDHWWRESLGLTYSGAQEKARQYLAEAEKHPTATSHQVAGNILRFQGHHEQALGEFRAAIALDPSDSWNYAFLAETLNFAGRPAEAIPSIQAAMRLDPHYPPSSPCHKYGKIEC